MGAKAIFKTGVSAIELSHTHRCYMLAESGEEVKVTKEMVLLACSQLLARCRNIKELK